MEVGYLGAHELGIQEDFRRGTWVVDDMCEEWTREVRQGVTDMEYHDEQTWKKLGPDLVVKGECEELKKMGV